jgi:hypothetical protein
MFHPSTVQQLTNIPRRRKPRRHPTSADEAAVLIRRASPADEPDIARLAALEERPELAAGDRLVGELGGTIVAALEVRSGRAVADPFVPTTAILELLGLRAAQVRRSPSQSDDIPRAAECSAASATKERDRWRARLAPRV